MSDALGRSQDAHVIYKLPRWDRNVQTYIYKLPRQGSWEILQNVKEVG